MWVIEMIVSLRDRNAIYRFLMILIEGHEMAWDHQYHTPLITNMEIEYGNWCLTFFVCDVGYSTGKVKMGCICRQMRSDADHEIFLVACREGVCRRQGESEVVAVCCCGNIREAKYDEFGWMVKK